jgi:hypothetical protein
MEMGEITAITVTMEAAGARSTEGEAMVAETAAVAAINNGRASGQR